MEAKPIFADDITLCPKCRSKDFWEYFTGLGEGSELIYIECVECGAKYYAFNYYRRFVDKRKADKEQ